METTERDEMTVAFGEQLNDDLAKQAESQSNTQHVWDEGFYVAQYKKHTTFKSEKEEFTRKDGSGTFKNVLFNIPIGMARFDLLGFAGRKGDMPVMWDAPKGFAFKFAFDEVKKENSDKLVEESVNGGLMLSCAKANGFVSSKTADLLSWYENNLVIIHIGMMKGNEKYPPKNIIRSIRPHKG